MNNINTVNNINSGNKISGINYKHAIYTTCDDNYVRYAIVALKQFQYYNKKYDAYIISSYISGYRAP